MIFTFLLQYYEFNLLIQGIMNNMQSQKHSGGIKLEKTLIILMLLIVIITSCIPAFATTDEDWTYDAFDGSESVWAEPELLDAVLNEVTYEDVMNNYTRNITRAEFCSLSVLLYEKLTGHEAKLEEDPFVDTDDPEILKAYKLGIVNGVSTSEFAPLKNITRQEMCVMIYRTLDAADYDVAVDMSEDFPFRDTDEMADWAINKIRFCYHNEIINGTGLKMMEPLENTTREQAVVLVNRTYLSFEDR